MEVLEKETYRNCLNAILSSYSESETGEEFREKLKEIEKKYGKENTKKVAGELLVTLKERNNEKN